MPQSMSFTSGPMGFATGPVGSGQFGRGCRSRRIHAWTVFRSKSLCMNPPLCAVDRMPTSPFHSRRSSRAVNDLPRVASKSLAGR